jgi:hypothetical protein
MALACAASIFARLCGARIDSVFLPVVDISIDYKIYDFQSRSTSDG